MSGYPVFIIYVSRYITYLSFLKKIANIKELTIISFAPTFIIINYTSSQLLIFLAHIEINFETKMIKVTQ
jgi:hypothetical protein